MPTVEEESAPLEGENLDGREQGTQPDGPLQRAASIHNATSHASALDRQASFTTAQPAAPSLDEQAALNIDLRLRHTKQLEAQRLNYENQIALLTKTAKEDLAAFVGEIRLENMT